MLTNRLIEDGLRTMLRYKLRSFFMMLGSLVGVAALTFVVSVGSGAERRLLGTVRQLFGDSSLMVSSGGSLILGGPRSEGERLTMEDLEAIATSLPSVESWDPVQMLDPAPVRFGDASTSARVVGSSERAERVWDRGVSRGEYFDATDVSRQARVALLGETVARGLFGSEDPVGSEVLIGGAPFKVTGVLERLGTDVHGLDRDNEIVVPITTAMRRLLNVDTVRGGKFVVREPTQVLETGREIQRLLRERHLLAAGQPDDFTVVTPVEVQKMVAKVQRVLFLFLPLVAAIALLAGGAVAASLMLLSVSERIGEIGLRRAVGARSSDIARQFLFETALTTSSGALLGVALGGVGALGVARRLGLATFVSWKAALLGIALAVLIGLLAGVAPARRAARLLPANALR
ncbi:MAG: ABC transporter permease [Deltaproteobacteria bacterium]|nr:ABC transporter permease [Deltaproteobacteria bacterium]